jgi:hypothetical protein
MRGWWFSQDHRLGIRSRWRTRWTCRWRSTSQTWWIERRWQRGPGSLCGGCGCCGRGVALAVPKPLSPRVVMKGGRSRNSSRKPAREGALPSNGQDQELVLEMGMKHYH